MGRCGIILFVVPSLRHRCHIVMPSVSRRGVMLWLLSLKRFVKMAHGFWFLDHLALTLLAVNGCSRRSNTLMGLLTSTRLASLLEVLLNSKVLTMVIPSVSWSNRLLFVWFFRLLFHEDGV